MYSLRIATAGDSEVLVYEPQGFSTLPAAAANRLSAALKPCMRRNSKKKFGSITDRVVNQLMLQIESIGCCNLMRCNSVYGARTAGALRASCRWGRYVTGLPAVAAKE